MNDCKNRLKDLMFSKHMHTLLIAVIGIMLYITTLHYPFVLDDRVYILGNPLLIDIDPFLLFFELDEFIDTYLQRLSHPPLAASFILRPIAYVSFYLNSLIGGEQPAGYRLVNIAIHISNAILFYHFLLSVIKHRDGAIQSRIKITIPFFAALLFLVHPLSTQSVTYIIQRFTSFAAFFYLAGMLLYVQSRIAGNTTARKWCYAASVLVLIMGLLTKENVLTLPVTLVMVDTILLGKPLRDTLKRLTPHIICMGMVPMQVLRIAQEMKDANQLLHSATDIVGGVYSRSEYAITQIRTILSYIRLLILPYNQNFDPDYPLYRSLLHPEIIISLFIWCVFIVAGMRLLRRQERNISTDLTAFSIFWFPVAISVSSSFIPLTDLMFEHRSYLPSAAFFTGSVAYINHVAASKGALHKNAAIGGLCLFALILSAATVQRNQLYSSRISLWKDTIKKSPNKARPYLSLGNSYLDNKQYDEAISCFDRSLDLNPKYIEAYVALGGAYLKMEMPQKTVDIYEEYLGLFPPTKGILMNLAWAYSQVERYSEAIDLFKLVLHTDGNNVGVLGYLAELKYRVGKYDKARLYLLKAMKADQEDPTVDLSNMIDPLNEQILEKIGSQ